MIMKHNLKLTMLIEKGDQDWFVGQRAEIPGVLTQGKTIEETKENLLDALDLYLEAR
jgi:predicted RNase H-like HicB family nuclease